MAIVDPAEKIIDDEHSSPAKEHPIIKHHESPEENGHKRKMSDNVADNECGDAKKKKTDDIEKPTAPEMEDTTAEDAVVAEQAEEAKSEETQKALEEDSEEKLLQGDVPETDVSAEKVDDKEAGEKKEADEVAPPAN